MRLTSRGEYALLALVFLARAGDEATVRAEDIATAQAIPQRFLEQILLELKRAKYVRSTRGQHGGYRLARPAADITLAEVIRLLDGALAPTGSVSRYFHEHTPIEREKKIVRVFKRIRDVISDTLERTTLAEVV